MPFKQSNCKHVDAILSVFDGPIWNSAAELNLKSIVELYLAGIYPSGLTKKLLSADGFLNFTAAIFNMHDWSGHGEARMYINLLFSLTKESSLQERFNLLQSILEKFRDLYLREINFAKISKNFSDFFNIISFFFKNGHERGSVFDVLILNDSDVSRTKLELDYKVFNDLNFYGGIAQWKSMGIDVDNWPKEITMNLIIGAHKYFNDLAVPISCLVGDCNKCITK
ncbi:MAG: hypothetical protein QE271_01625 [Bacteriovoracaceae bacterium]|nr:hypothetical protein [Bacteriovoracaceae bacterium]